MSLYSQVTINPFESLESESQSMDFFSCVKIQLFIVTKDTKCSTQ